MNANLEGTPQNKAFVSILVVGGLGGFIFGYDTAIIAGALPAIIEDFEIVARSTIIQGTITTSILLGSVIGAAFGATIGKILTKRNTILVLGIISAIGCLCTAFGPDPYFIVLAREITGIGVGLSTVIVPTFIAELAPRKYSGAFGSWFQVSFTFGIFVSYLVNLAFSSVKYNFRWMFGLGVIPSLLLCFYFPVIPTIKSHNSEEDHHENTSGLKIYKNLFIHCRRQMFVGFILAVCLQLTGISAIFDYAPSIFENAGLDGQTTTLLATVGVGGWNFISTFISIGLVDKVGRKPLLLIGMGIMVITLFLLGTLFEFVSSSYPKTSGIISIFLLFIYITGFEMGIGSLFWPLLTETFPLEYKDYGASVLNVIQWSLNILLAASFPSLVKLLSQAVVFWLFGIIGLICLVLLFFFLPETKFNYSQINSDSF